MILIKNEPKPQSTLAKNTRSDGTVDYHQLDRPTYLRQQDTAKKTRGGRHCAKKIPSIWIFLHFCVNKKIKIFLIYTDHKNMVKQRTLLKEVKTAGVGVIPGKWYILLYGLRLSIPALFFAGLI